jgi:NTE family protein
MEISLVLGGGGVRGFAHIGVLRVLEQEGFRIRAIAGSSIGGLIGAAYASGHSPDAIEEYIKGLDQSNLFGEHGSQNSGFRGVERIRSEVHKLLGNTTFAQLQIPLAANAVDISTGELLTLQTGLLADAVMATIALPGVFPPVSWDGRTVFDGGVVNPIPVSLARTLAPGLPVVAVALTRPLAPWPRPSPIDRIISRPYLTNLLRRTRYFNSIDLFIRSFEIMSHRLTSLELSLDPPDATIRPDTHHIETLSKVDVEEVIQLGEAAAVDCLPELNSLPQSIA